jgi:hypothetical protein
VTGVPPAIGARRRLAACVLLIAAACGPPNLSSEGGSWYTGYASSTHTGLAKVDLYYVDDGARRTKVDEDVLTIRFYPPDCILYEPGRDQGSIYAACGDRAPVRVAFHAPWRMFGGWEAEDDGLRQTVSTRVVDGRAVAEVAHVPLPEILRVAQGAPVRGIGTALVEGDPAPVLEPAVTDVLVDPASRDRNGWTPLMHAVRDSQPTVVDALLRAGADPSAHADGGITAMQLAIGAVWPDTAIVRRLLDAGADTELVDALGVTPLILAALGRNVAIVKMLLEHGANPCTRDQQGRTLTSFAADHPELRRIAAEATARCGQPS